MTAQLAQTILSPPLAPPDPKSCPGNGLRPCVHTVYAEELTERQARCAALRAAATESTDG